MNNILLFNKLLDGNIETKPVNEKEQILEEYEIKLSPQEKALLQKLDMEHAQKLKKEKSTVQLMNAEKESEISNKSENPENRTEADKSSDDKTVIGPQAIPHSSAKDKVSRFSAKIIIEKNNGIITVENKSKCKTTNGSIHEN